MVSAMRFSRRSNPDATAPASESPRAPATDAPFVYGDPINPSLERVVNDVYARNRTGKKWHRVYAVSAPHPRLVDHGRSFLLVCGGVAFEFEPDPPTGFTPTPLRLDIPEPAEICGSCRQSDAKYGKGDIPDKTRWDR
jgi:hypothetical protein